MLSRGHSPLFELRIIPDHPVFLRETVGSITYFSLGDHFRRHMPMTHPPFTLPQDKYIRAFPLCILDNSSCHVRPLVTVDQPHLGIRHCIVESLQSRLIFSIISLNNFITFLVWHSCFRFLLSNIYQ